MSEAATSCQLLREEQPVYSWNGGSVLPDQQPVVPGQHRVVAEQVKLRNVTSFNPMQFWKQKAVLSVVLSVRSSTLRNVVVSCTLLAQYITNFVHDV